MRTDSEERVMGDDCSNCKWFEECDLSYEDCQFNPINQEIRG